MKKGSMCRLKKTVSGGRPLKSVYKGESVLLLKHFGGGFFKVYCAKERVMLTVHETNLEAIQ